MATESRSRKPREGSAQEFQWPVRVYYEDTDAAGVVYHSNYLKFMERARTEWLRALGFSQQRLREEEGILFVVTDMTVSFQRPARFDDQLDVTTRIRNMNAASLIFSQAIINATGKPVCAADVTVACLDAAGMKPRRIPAAVRKEFDHDG